MNDQKVRRDSRFQTPPPPPPRYFDVRRFVAKLVRPVLPLGWSRQGHGFDFWASSKANADAGRFWRNSGESVATAAAEGKTLSVYAVWDYNWPWEGGPSSD